ncbi:MAG: M23 family metallopeptidase [Trichlorobacter sp.]|uniref:M23 family metallopeptidase n=1 Tax=Trichlorobacter sp. TaxID=2911007 RepID=UPI0025669949|nr:M23 family metallopeptidase [Trichlorobacter sp.]MDK9719210.1 M23 family metallopeptidase [Trichlorobacter sp.]
MNCRSFRFFILTCLLLCAVTDVLPLKIAQADIYRFVTIDGVESFTDSPLQKDAQVVMRETVKGTRKKAARTISKESTQTPAPSLKEIIEKTVETQINPEHNSTDIVEALLPVDGTITSGVGVRVDPVDGQLRHHNGIDIAVPTGTSVHAVASGVVVYAGLRSGYGWTVLIEHDNGMVTLYGHNSKLNVQQSQAVKKGEVIALAGSTGRSTGPHVHFEAWQSGNNITAAFMPGSTLKIASAGHSYRQRANFRKEVLSDGSMLITNIPSSIP